MQHFLDDLPSLCCFSYIYLILCGSEIGTVTAHTDYVSAKTLHSAKQLSKSLDPEPQAYTGRAEVHSDSEATSEVETHADSLSSAL